MKIVPAREMFKDILIIINSFIHDMTTGVWVGCLIVMKAALLKVDGFQSDLVGQYAVSLLNGLWTLSLISFTIMILTGAARVFTLKNYGWTGDIARERKRLLVVKHVILGVIVVIGLITQIQLYMGMQN